jgi:hypothetical protein
MSSSQCLNPGFSGHPKCIKAVHLSLISHIFNVLKVVNLFEKVPQESIDVFVRRLLIQPTKGAVKLRTHVAKCAENLLRLQQTFNANTNVLNFVIPDPVLPA